MRVVIFDEISMATWRDICQLDKFFRALTGPILPFAGIIVVLAGDFCLLWARHVGFTVEFSAGSTQVGFSCGCVGASADALLHRARESGYSFVSPPCQPATHTHGFKIGLLRVTSTTHRWCALAAARLARAARLGTKACTF